MNRPAAVFFDLDGTLLDTAPALGYALNAVRAEYDLQPLPATTIRPRVSAGSYALTELGFGLSRADPRFEPLRLRLLDVYAENLTYETRVFPGMDTVLDRFDRETLPWGVVTNKPGWLAEPLLTAMGLRARARCVVSGDTVAERKPHPLPLLHAAQLVTVPARSCVYVGDDPRDVEAGRRAGMYTLIANFGYIAAEAEPVQWGADAILDTPLALLDWLAIEP
jgi:phosphoglycolate phosphatase